jgi:hypothetical protein
VVHKVAKHVCDLYPGKFMKKLMWYLHVLFFLFLSILVLCSFSLDFRSAASDLEGSQFLPVRRFRAATRGKDRVKIVVGPFFSVPNRGLVGLALFFYRVRNRNRRPPSLSKKGKVA